MLRGIFIAEGTSDSGLSTVVSKLFRDRGIKLDLVNPDLSLLSHKVNLDVKSKMRAAIELEGSLPDIFVIHRDADSPDSRVRRAEIFDAISEVSPEVPCVAVVPAYMTETWLLLDEAAIRMVSGNPKGRVALDIPKVRNIERKSDTKSLLRQLILTASEQTGRKRTMLSRRFGGARSSLFQHIDFDGPIATLESWSLMIEDIDACCEKWSN